MDEELMEDIDLYNQNYQWIKKVKEMIKNEKYSFENEEEYLYVIKKKSIIFLLEDICEEYNIDKRKEYEYLLLNISLKYSKQRFRIIENSVFDLRTTYYTLLSSIKKDHLIELKNIDLNHDNVVEICEYLPHLSELYQIELTNCKMSKEDVKMLKESVKHFQVSILKRNEEMIMGKRRRVEDNTFEEKRKESN